MTLEKPAYFDEIRLRAVKRWDQLEMDPELAGPWHQLFKQVQSPRHILSELLQNADDAGATEAAAWVEDGVFTFEHNGEDFTEVHFASLCCFAYSNKRALHTIGFRGIGFKSTFSLGARVELHTPSLCVAFHRHRFTEPVWIPAVARTDGHTRIRVEISDHHRQRELEKNLSEWLKSPVSLLFFRNIRRMRIGENEVHWGSLGPGPVPNSEYMALYEKEEEQYLLIRSDLENFPEEALTEIRDERMLVSDEGAEFPPCKIEIVLGAPGRLYVVLPTGVETELPFACNAPFIQDPARLKIKDPETSPTNRWLLERAGELAASSMLHWLGNERTPLAERARAYALFTDVDREDNSLEGVCGAIAEDAFAECIDGKDVLLTEVGKLVPDGQSVIVPAIVLDIWSAEQVSALLDPEARPTLCHMINVCDQKKLLRWGVVEDINKEKLIGVLQEKHLPKPKSWRQLLLLWGYIAPEITGYDHDVNAEEVKIIPVQGKDVLYGANEVVRLGEKKLLQSDGDWEFLSQYLIVLNQKWPRFLAELRRSASEGAGTVDLNDIEAAYAVLEEIGLDDTSNTDQIIDQVVAEFFGQDSILKDCVQLAQISAKLGAKVGNSFKYFTRDCVLRSADKTILFDEDGLLGDLLSKAQRETNILHQDYSINFTSCSAADWKKWIASGQSNLLTFSPLVSMSTNVYGKHQIEQEAKRRGHQGELSYHFKTCQFIVEDWDFEETCWSHWHALAAKDEQIWAKLAERILAQRETYWSQAKSARLLQVATTGNTRSMTWAPLLPSWALKLRKLPCLPDTRGVHRKPDDLLRRTSQTESLMDVESFVHNRLDQEATRPLLDLLGVRSLPTGPDRLIDCLRALAKANKPPVHEVEKWYRRLDQMVETCSTADFQKIRQALRTEKLILTHDGSWATASSVFLMSDDEDVPDAAVIRSSVSDLALWRKIGVSDRPTADLAIEWLKCLGSGAALAQEDARRVRSLLVRHPVRIWEECGHWLSLAGEWSPVENLAYALTMQTLTPWRHLHQWVKQATADLQRLPGEATSNPPFSELPLLAAQIEERFQEDPLFAGQPLKKEWLRTLGVELCRIELDAEEETNRVRAVAAILAKTEWVETPDLEIIPYINGTPAGTPRRADVVWLDERLYVEPLPKAKLARRVPEEIGKIFARADIKAALDYSFDRSSQDVREYLAENFAVAPAPTLPAVADVPSGEDPDQNVPEAEPTPDPSDLHTDEPVTASDDTTASPETYNENPAHEAHPDDEEDHPPLDGIDTRPKPTSKPSKLSIIERFARDQGFLKDSETRFFHENGSWIAKTHGVRFPWEHRTTTGDLIRYYLPKDHCLEQDPLQVEADIWGLIEQHPDTYALILSSLANTPVEMRGNQLLCMIEQGKIILYPASYRLVYKGV